MQHGMGGDQRYRRSTRCDAEDALSLEGGRWGGVFHLEGRGWGLVLKLVQFVEVAIGTEHGVRVVSVSRREGWCWLEYKSQVCSSIALRCVQLL